MEGLGVWELGFDFSGLESPDHLYLRAVHCDSATSQSHQVVLGPLGVGQS